MVPHPADTSIAFVIATGDGVVRRVYDPSPTRPSPFQPQHLIVPPGFSRAHAWAESAEIFVALTIPTTSTGVVRVFKVPSPSWPAWL